MGNLNLLIVPNYNINNSLSYDTVFVYEKKKFYRLLSSN